MQLTLKEEFRRLYCEANVLYWAKALLKMMYNYIDSSMNEADKPPFEIPHLCFIDTGLLLVYSNRPNTSKGPGNTQTGMVSTVYLAEELIPLSNDVDFMKYIHNGNAASCWLANATANEIMEFLAFTQHVQYFKTGSQVYISDYQGTFKSSIAVIQHKLIPSFRESITVDRTTNSYTPVRSVAALNPMYKMN
ncbi:hypothetical protein J3A83DRAFT_4101041 [Scleroderma citrinum]